MGATAHYNPATGKMEYYGGSVPIDDTDTSTEKTWSSEKIDSEINNINKIKPNINLSNVYSNDVGIVALGVSITFTNGTGTIDISNYKPVDKTYAQIAFANIMSSSSVYITGATVDNETNILTVKCLNTYSGSIFVYALVFYH